MWIMYVRAFIFGGLLCGVGQIFTDKTRLTPARIMVTYVCIGTLLTLSGIYEPFVKFAGAGATVPIAGFGYALGKGVLRGISEYGLLGVMTGGLTATAGGITAAVFFASLIAFIFSPKRK